MEVKDIVTLMKAVSENELTCFELEQGDTKITMKRGKIPVLPQNTAGDFGMAGAAGNAGLAGAADIGRAMGPETGGRDAGSGSAGRLVVSPLVGTFYSAPSPDAEDFVKVGDPVRKGQTVGIVEAMKLMNEIECEYDGVVEEILVGDGDIVEYGQPLFRIR